MNQTPFELLYPQVSFPAELPISGRAAELIAAIAANQVIIVAGETGSGKTTQLPKMCISAGLGKKGLIGCTQPRRIAALSVSRRIAEELHCSWSREVGCKVRFADNTCKDTVIKVMTDGTLLAEIHNDPLLKKYEALIIDEAHERSLNIDFLLGYLRKIRAKRPELKIIITSATIDTALFSAAFDNAPIFEVSGRMYPVEIRYEPFNAGEEDDSDEITHIDAAITSTERVLSESVDGDVLLFMPSERDIRECKDRLQGRFKRTLDVLPLMGSLSAEEQERVFKHTGRRKIIVATNIAETSLTIPNIRYVIDTGLARISRFNPKTRTKRLPIEEISQSSANQRAGRAGRVREGVCIRLYEARDFQTRPEFTDPEITRANLAEVILLMKAFGIGDIEEFPFLNPPEPRAIRSGVNLLQELGALDENYHLTKIGKELSRLPVDPTIGRILLQSSREHCVRDILIIAAGLSVQDPRERPMEAKDKAELAHRKLLHPDSDFLTLLRIWYEYTSASEQGRGAVKRFCKENFLSNRRLREWSDAITELSERIPRFTESELPHPDTISRFDGRYRAIHRSILAGFVGQIGFRVGRNTYHASGGREATIFPGSSLFEKRGLASNQTKKKRDSGKDPNKERWIVCAEIVETTKLFARSAAHIQPQWVLEVAQHLIRKGYDEAYWDVSRQAAVVPERSILQGLLVGYRKVPFSHINPVESCDLLIRSLLTNPDEATRYPFAQDNRRLCDKIANHLATIGKLNRTMLEENLVQFYAKRLPPIGSTIDLDYFIKNNGGRDVSILRAEAKDLWDSDDLNLNDPNFPDSLSFAGASVAVHYSYDPGKQSDGVSMSIPLALAKKLPSRSLDGAIPGLRQIQIVYLLRSLPKQLRLQLDSYVDTARLIAQDVQLMELPLIDAIVAGLARFHSLKVSPELISFSTLPDHLRPRIVVVDGTRVVASGRDLDQLRPLLDGDSSSNDGTVWQTTRSAWERTAISSWDMKDLPPSIEVGRISGVVVSLYPALVLEQDSVALRLLESEVAALRESEYGINRLLELNMRAELQSLERQTREAETLTPLILLFCSGEQLRKSLLKAAKSHLFSRPSSRILSAAEFNAALNSAKARVPGLMTGLLTISKTILELRRSILQVKRPYRGMREDLSQLIPPTFLEDIPFEQLQQLPRYMKAMLMRAERADSNPAKDEQKWSAVAPFIEKIPKSDQSLPPNFKWLIEELKVSVFAPELGTPFPISATRLERLLAEYGSS